MVDHETGSSYHLYDVLVSICYWKNSVGMIYFFFAKPSELV